MAMERNVNGKGNREAATWDLRKTAPFCLASRFCKLPESSAAGNQHWSYPESLLLLPWELVLEPLMELLCLVIFASCDIEISSEEAIETAKQLMLKEGLFNNGILWLPPEPEDAEDERETFLVDEDDEDNDGNGNAIGEWGYLCNLNSFGSGEHRHKGRTSEEQKNKDRTSEEHRRLQILEPKSRVDIGSFP
ncbi:1-phosphatidylinositol-3-phosphate 5-kinase [Arachis hypogaea]|nr:uncharacterized protein LOC112784525 [Arachis hypogaea]QHO47785.1 1-phosphatidylinositol-3-phosphate 5-kinase [Arachis hypogaea]